MAASWTALDMRQTTVKGPTPPGTGVRKAGMSQAVAGSMSPLGSPTSITVMLEVRQEPVMRLA